MNIKKSMALVLAAGMMMGMTPASAFAADDTSYTKFPYTIEAEDMDNTKGELITKVYQDEFPGYSGKGFVYLTSKNFSFTVNVKEDGMYELTTRALQFITDEGRMQTVSVNGTDYTKVIPMTRDWIDFDFGMVRLHKGKNTLTFKPIYGYMVMDTVTLEKAKFPSLSPATDKPCDPKADASAKELLKYLKKVYGKHILSGQQEIYGGGHKNQTTIRYDAATNTCKDSSGKTYTFKEEDKAVADDGSKFVWHCYDEDGQVYDYDSQNRGYSYCDYDYEMKYLEKTTGKLPAIRGFDFGSYCPCYKWDDGVANRMIDWGKNKGGICTASWHVNVPKVMSSYTYNEPLDFSATTYTPQTDFVTANCLKKGTAEYDYYNLCVKNLATELKKIQKAGVPIIFRPFHEAEGNGGLDGSGAWFWWSKEGADVFKALWKNLYKQLTEDYGIHNLIWEENLYTWSNTSKEWYVGDEYTDLVAYDKYNTQYHRHDGKTSGPNLDAESGYFWELNDYVKGKKMVAMAENDSIPSLENLKVEHASWLYFCPWYDDEQSPFVSGTQYQDKKELTKLYKSNYCITLDELPKWKSTK